MATTSALLALASAWEPSVLPLSATTTSPSMPLRARKPRALVMHEARVSASFKHGIKMVNSQGRPIAGSWAGRVGRSPRAGEVFLVGDRSEEHTSELQSHLNLV